MRTLAATTLFVCLTASVFAQAPNGTGELNGKDSAERIAFRNRQVRLVDSYRNSGDYQAAECVLREWLAAEPAGTESHTMVQNALADLLREVGRQTEARRLFSEIANGQNTTATERMNALVGLADVDMHQGDYKTSIEEWNGALDIARHEQDASTEAAALRGLGRAWLSAGSPARAEPLLRHSVSMLENEPSASLELAASLGALAEYYQTANKLALAEEAWSRALELERATFGDNHPQTAFFMQALAELYSQRGESALAVEYAGHAADVMRQWFGDGSPITAAALLTLASVEQRAHTLNAAAKHYEAAVRVLRKSPPEVAATMKAVLHRYAELLKTMHRDEEARALDAEAKAFRSN